MYKYITYKSIEDIEKTKGVLHAVVGSSLVLLTSLLMPFTGPKGPVVHLNGLTGMAKGHL